MTAHIFFCQKQRYHHDSTMSKAIYWHKKELAWILPGRTRTAVTRLRLSHPMHPLQHCATLVLFYHQLNYKDSIFWLTRKHQTFLFIHDSGSQHRTDVVSRSTQSGNSLSGHMLVQKHRALIPQKQSSPQNYLCLLLAQNTNPSLHSEPKAHLRNTM